MFPAEIGDIGFPPRALEHYTAALEATVDIEAIRAAQFKVVVDYSFGSTSFVMPNVLAKLGADVLGVNPYASTEPARWPSTRRRTPQEVAALVKASGAHLGAVLDPDGEHLTLIDDAGHVLGDDQSLLALLSLVSSHLLGDTVALPVTVTQHAEAIAEAHGVRVRRTKLSASALMDAAAEPGVGLRGEHRWRVHPPGLPARLRCRRHPGEGARAAGAVRAAAVPGASRSCRGRASPGRRSSPRGSRRAWSCARSWR